MTEITACKNDPSGDYLSWNSSKWILSGDSAFAKTISSDIVCQPRNGTALLFPSLVASLVADETCRKLKGTLWAPRNDKEHAIMYNTLKGNTKLEEGL